MKMLLIISLLLNFAMPANMTSMHSKALPTDQPSITGQQWQMQEIRFLYDNTPYYYQRGNDKETTINFDNDYIFFSNDGKGTYHQANGEEYPIKWHNSEKKNAIEFTISKFRDDSYLTVNWENIEVSLKELKYTEYYTHQDGRHVLGHGIRASMNNETENLNTIN